MKLAVIALGAVILSAIIYFLIAPTQTPSTNFVKPVEQKVVGGDKDAHGCIGSAGYQWCQPKEKCLRIWEESCYSSIEEKIGYFIADKYDKKPQEVKIIITKQTDAHYSGSISFTAGRAGLFLAKKQGNIWEVVYEGNGSLDCDQLKKEHQFPSEVLSPNFCD